MVKYTLVGCDGNAFAVMGYVINAIRESGRKLGRLDVLTKGNIDNYKTLAMSSDYNNLLAVSVSTIDDINDSLEKAGLIDADDDEVAAAMALLASKGFNVSRR